jgi:hypothetical protein
MTKTYTVKTCERVIHYCFVFLTLSNHANGGLQNFTYRIAREKSQWCSPSPRSSCGMKSLWPR